MNVGVLRQALRLFPRATGIGNAAGCHTRYEDPGPSHLLRKEKSNKCAGPPPQEVRLNRWHENSKAVSPPTNPAHVPAQSPR